jgi:hypothetical protein
MYTPVRTEKKKLKLAIRKKILSGRGWRTGRSEDLAEGETGSVAVDPTGFVSLGLGKGSSAV